MRRLHATGAFLLALAAVATGPRPCRKPGPVHADTRELTVAYAYLENVKLLQASPLVFHSFARSEVTVARHAVIWTSGAEKESAPEIRRGFDSLKVDGQTSSA